MRNTFLAAALVLSGTAAFGQDVNTTGPVTGPASDTARPAPSQSSPVPAPPAPGQPASAQPTPPAPGQPATMSDNLRPTFVAQAPEDMVASKIIGTGVVNAANETIGQIADVVLAPSGGIKSWVIGVGGFLGLGTKHVAVDPSALKLERVDGKDLRATIDTTKDQLRAAPEYVYLGKEKPN